MSDNPWAPQATPEEGVSDLTVPRASLAGAAPAGGPSATIQFDDGTVERLARHTLIGRDPVPDNGMSAQIVKLADDQKGVSKSHLAIDFVDGGLSARDLGSTNETAVLRRGTQVPVPAGVWTPLETGDLVVLGGTRSFTVTHAPVGAPQNDITMARPRSAAPPAATVAPPAQAPAAPPPPPGPVTSIAPARARCQVCGDVLDSSARFCVVCGTPVEGGAAPVGVHPADLAAAPIVGAGARTPAWRRLPVQIGVGLVAALVVLGALVVLRGGGDDASGSNSGLPRVPSGEPEQRDFADSSGDGELWAVRGAPNRLYALRVDGDDAEVVAFDAAGAERWTEPVDGSANSLHVVDGRVVVSGRDDDGDLVLVAYSADGNELWQDTPRGDDIVTNGSYLYVTGYDPDTGSTDSYALIDTATGATKETVDGDFVVDVRNAILAWDDDKREVSAYSLDLQPLLEGVVIDDEDQWPMAYHDGVIVTVEDDELFGYDVEGEVWETRVEVGALSDAYPLGNGRWLLSSDEEGRVSVESGVGRDTAATTVWEVDGDDPRPANGGVVVVREYDDDGGGDVEVTLYDANGAELGDRLENADLVDTANDLLFRVADGDGDAQYVAYSIGGAELWSGRSTDHSLRVLDNGYAIVESELDARGGVEYTIEVFG